MVLSNIRLLIVIEQGKNKTTISKSQAQFRYVLNHSILYIHYFILTLVLQAKVSEGSFFFFGIGFSLSNLHAGRRRLKDNTNQAFKSLKYQINIS